MKKVFLYFAALTAVAVACRKVEIEPQGEVDPEPEVEMITETITGSRDVSTKVTIDNTSGAFAWTATNDLVAVHVSTGEYVTSAGASASAKSASFDVTYPAGATRDAFAVFPSTIVAADAANYGQEGHTLDVTLPSSYTLAQVSGETSPCPMIATNDPGSSEWSFKQLCGLLRLTVNDIPVSTKRLEIDFDGKKVCGDFSIASPEPGTSKIETTADPSHDKITITKDGTDVVLGETSLVLNFPLPIGDYSGITVVAYTSLSGGTPSLVGTVPFGYTAKLAKATKRTASLNLHVFSINASQYAIFSPGNLQATTSNGGTDWTWSFAPHQYDIIGFGGTTGNANVTYGGTHTISITSGTIDLFSYSTMDNYYGIGDRNIPSTGEYRDWGTNNIGGYGSNYWRTLSEAEWQYVVGENTYRHHSGSIQWSIGSETHVVVSPLCTKARINTDVSAVRGFILFPDGYNGGAPTGIAAWGESYISSGNMQNSGTTGFTPAITSTDWTMLESAGCVFLPLAGVRYEKYPLYFEGGLSGTNSNPGGYYMSSDNKSPNTVLHFGTTTGFDPNWSFNRAYGGSVRLIHVL